MANQTHVCQVGEIPIGRGNPLVIIAGPCALESRETNALIASTMRDICERLGLPYIFKASFDKANRSSIHSDRGPGPEEGLAEIARIASEFALPTTTDIHAPEQAAMAAEIVDLLQIPAFLSRQTDLLAAAAVTGKPVNVKKGQFMAPVEMNNIITKLSESGCDNIMLTERGTFFGYHRLVNDFTGLGDLMQLGPPVCFDVTHSTQLPGGDTTKTAGRPERAPLLAKAATAAGVDALFFECHPQPANGVSDQSTMLPLDSMEELLKMVVAIRSAIDSR